MSHPHQQCLIAEFATQEKLQLAMEVLDKTKLSADEISVVTDGQDEGLRELMGVKDTAPGEASSEQAAAATTLAGGALGAAIGTATMVGPFLIAGPLAGMAVGAVSGGLLGGVERWGVNHEVADGYESKVREGSKLIIIAAEATRLNHAERALKTINPKSLERFELEED
ncbi:DUF1269 domain-containing protein [Roseiconus nitratireducens]|nr:DUF1269 domain-containing protein [Roseiconus nitratireducens]